MPLPIYQEIPYQEPLQVFETFAQSNGAIFLESASAQANCGRYSFIGVEPFQILTNKNAVTTLHGNTSENPFALLEQELEKFSLALLPNLPPLQGGVVGYFGYELYQHLENIPLARHDAMHFPDMQLGFYDLIIAFDHERQQAWIFSSGFPETDEAQRQKHAHVRLQYLLMQIPQHAPVLPQAVLPDVQVTSNFTPSEYMRMVETTKELILAGDIFEANVSRCFSASLPAHYNHFELYKRLRTLNPAPFAAFLNFAEETLISASPERFMQMHDRKIEARPIKGTRARSADAEKDGALAEELRTSSKDRAENIMIVDLLRNDLSKVCKDDSVHVTQLCGLESFATVHHLVSVIVAELLPEYGAVDLLRATFPGGSITGAPKCRAMEIIAQLEPTTRGPYCGSIGYISFAGTLDLSITIRTFAIKDQQLTFQAGGAVVKDSDPETEFHETTTKARALLAALGVRIA